MLKSIDYLLLNVTDLKSTVDFYESLGFTKVALNENFAEVELNGFKLQFITEPTVGELKRVFSSEVKKGEGMFIYILVEDVDKYFKLLTEKGINTSHEPRDWPWGQRELVVKDPDGYKLVFYRKNQ